MFWHEVKENEINLLPYNKTDYIKMINPKLNNKDLFDDLANVDDKNVLDISDNFKVDMLVPSDWGEGKVVSVDKATKKVVLKIEGVEKEFSMFELRPYIIVYTHIYLKDKNGIDKRIILSLNLLMDDTIGKIKKKIAGIFNVDEKNIIIVHEFLKLTNNNQKVSELHLFDKNGLLVIINGKSSY